MPDRVGDLLWATMVFFVVSAWWPGAGRWRCGAAALMVSYLVELTQLYRSPWLDLLRSTTAGHLILGSTFSFTDLAAYTVGVGAGITATWPLMRRSADSPPGR
ncbi:hypothetical protein ABIB25_001144 [Nakamurella sp. UYEF19]|uniref:ribosomal maturation YjgA family protein n=1 Tax=Nakamurella sp. UYEF19 TaxID=1756392 RepID=UPI0033967EF1